MKKILFTVLFIIFFTGCAKWEILSPVNGELTVVLLNVYVTFEYDTPQLIVLNENYGVAYVKVSRRVDDAWTGYTEILNCNISGRSEIAEKAYFKTGDKIELYIKIDNRDEDDPERWTYFQLGKKAIGAKIFPDDIGKDFKIIEINPDKGSMIIEFTLD